MVMFLNGWKHVHSIELKYYRKPAAQSVCDKC